MTDAISFKEILKEERKAYTKQETLEYLRTTKMVLGEEVIQECLRRGLTPKSKKYFFEDKPETPIMRFEVSGELFQILEFFSKQRREGKK